MTRFMKTALLLAGVISLAGCSGKPVPQALVGEWICNHPAGKILNKISYDSTGKFSAVLQDLTQHGYFSVEGDQITYPGLSDTQTLQQLPIIFQESPGKNTIKFGFGDAVGAIPNMAECRREN